MSSQVQCANALAPFVARPSELRDLFGTVLPLAEVLPFAPVAHESPLVTSFDREDHVVFEWIGLSDHLGEWKKGLPTRGANATSADAAIRYRAHNGAIELALIEWKYTEEYQGHRLSGGEASLETRRKRYMDSWMSPEGPIMSDGVPFDDLLVEPFYQLMRQQLLAWRMESANELGADIVRCVVVAPSRNAELLTSFNRSTQRLDGADHVYAAWSANLRRPDRFGVLDGATFVAEGAPTSAEYKARYGHIAVDESVRMRIDAS